MPMSPQMLVFDTGPLSHVAKQGWLGALRFIVSGCCAVIPDTVVAELRVGLPHRPYLDMVLNAPWLDQHILSSPAELDAFATFSSFLVAKGRNRGEAGVLAYAKVHGATAIIDDRPARNVAQKHGITCRGTLSLVCDAGRLAGKRIPTALQTGSVRDLGAGQRLDHPLGCARLRQPIFELRIFASIVRPNPTSPLGEKRITMTGAEHYAAAEALLDEATGNPERIATAQVHATLALAAATAMASRLVETEDGPEIAAMDPTDQQHWDNAAG